MKTDALKLELIEWLSRTSDEGLLKAIQHFKNSNAKMDWANQLTDEQRQAIQQGLDDIKNGKTVSREKVWAKYGRKPKA